MKEELSKGGLAVVAENLGKRFSGNLIHPLMENLLGISREGERDFHALRDISFEIKKGEAVGILGENGSGKSTLLQLIAKTMMPSSGRLRTNGKLAALLELGSGFNPDFTGRENVYLNASILGLSKSRTDQVLDDILGFADIGDFVDRPVKTYSSGMRMRLAFAVQVFVEPEILIIDEALGVGDQFFRKKCHEKINELLNGGITFLYVTHNEETLRQLTNRVFLLHQGRLVLDGGVQECVDEYNLIMGQRRRTHIPDLARKSELDGRQPDPDPGSGRGARILGVKVFGQDESECNHFQPGDSVRISLDFVTTGKFEGLSAGLRIRNKEGVKIYSWATANQDASFVSETGRGGTFAGAQEGGSGFTVEYEFRCNLGSNLYQIEAFITDDHHNSLDEKDVLDWVSEAAFFRVDVDQGDHFFGGVCDLGMKAVLKRSGRHEPDQGQVDYGRLYDGYWALPDRHGSESFENASAVVTEILDLLPDGRILDVGCGMGGLVHEFSSRGFDVLGLDPSRKAIDYCRENCSGSFETGSVLRLPFEDQSFDTVVSTDCLEHLAEDDLPLAIREIARVARRQVYLRIATRPDRDKKWHLTVKPRKWWEDLLLGHGFRLHPASQTITPFESLETEKNDATICLQKIPLEVHLKYPAKWLLERRDLHADMLRESNRRSDSHLARYQMAREASPLSGQVLDVACGMGYGSHVLGFGRPDLSVLGVDMDEDAIEYCNANFSTSKGNLRFEREKVEGLTERFPEASFDLICSFETIEHIEDPESFLHSVQRLLRPNGTFICSVPNMWVDETGEDPNPHHLHVFDFLKLKDLVSPFLHIDALYSQIAGNGMKYPDHPRLLRKLDSNEKLEEVEAEWCLLRASKR